MPPGMKAVGAGLDPPARHVGAADRPRARRARQARAMDRQRPLPPRRGHPDRARARREPRREPRHRAGRGEGAVGKGPRAHGAPLRHPHHARGDVEPARRRRHRLARSGPPEDAAHLRRDHRASQHRRAGGGRAGRDPRDPGAERDDPRGGAGHAPRARPPGALPRRLPLPPHHPRIDPEPGHAPAAAGHPHDAAGLLRVRRPARERSRHARGPPAGRRSDRPPRRRRRPRRHGEDAGTERKPRPRPRASSRSP